MSGTFPSSPTASAANLTSHSPTLVSVSQSLKRQVRSVGAQRFQLELEYQKMTRALMDPIFAFAMLQRGQFGSFLIALPPPYNVPRGTWANSGGVKVDGGSQSGRTVRLKGFLPFATVSAGDLLTFAGHAKLYAISANGTADSGGILDATIEPGLYATPANNEAVTSTGVQMTAAFSSDIVASKVSRGQLYDYGMALVEQY